VKSGSILVCITLAVAGVASAQTPTIDAGGVVNAASYAYAGLPSGGIAQGSLFAIFGKNLGPTPFVQPTTFPIPTTLGGVSVKVTSGSTTGQALMFLASSGQITALLPSNIPVGTASLTVTTSAGTSAAQSFQVVASSFGVFSLNSGGTGAAVITNPGFKPFTLSNSANPDETAVLWGTGLGPVSGNEAGGALPGDLTNIPVEVYFGNTKANITYRGRSGSVGVDQINFTVPNILGCRVPVVVKINNVVSNQTALPIAAKGSRTCTDPGAPSAADLQKFSQNGLAVGTVALSRTKVSISVPFLGSIDTFADTGSASFVKFTPAQLDASVNPFGVPQIGACSVAYVKGSSSAAVDPTLPKTLDAGAQITVSGNGTKTLAKSSVGGFTTYSGLLSSLDGQTGYLNPGTFTVTGPGGTEVGGFTSSLTLGASLNWTNSTITDVTRSAGQVINWTGGDANGTVLITGTSTLGTTDAIGAYFQCYANASAGTFTIPAQVLLALPVSATVSGVPTGSLAVGQYSTPKAFSASGLDYGYLVYTNLSLKTLNYK
jgi:uncharacterized protein (TIGR03437 family)